MADSGARGVYRFGPFHLDVRERRLSRGPVVIPLRLKVFDTLRVLVENAGRLVTKQELLDTVWPDTSVEENNLNHNVSVLRKALGDGATGQQYIETVPRVGYRFAAPVEAALPQAGTSAASAAKARQEIRYCTTSDGVRLAYASIGQRTAAREGVKLADASGLRMGQPDLASLVRCALASPPPRPLRRARQWHVPA